MFESLAGQLRGGVPDRLASVLDTDLRDTRRAMEVSLPALIGGLRDKTLEPDGADSLVAILDGPAGEPIDDVEGYLIDHDPRLGAGLLDQVFGSRGETALTSLGKASGLGTKLLAQVMSMLAPVAAGWLNGKRQTEGYNAKELASYLDSEAAGLESAGYGKVLALVSGESAPAPRPAETSSVPPVGAVAPVRAASPSVVTVADQIEDSEFEDDLRIPATPDQLDASAIPGSAGGAPTVVIGDGAPGIPGSNVPVGSPPAPNVLPSAADAGDRDFDYGGSNRFGYLWWLLAALALACLGALLWVQCTGDDDVAEVETGTEAAAETEQAEDVLADAPPPDTQAVLTQTMAQIPGVTGLLTGDVATLSGSVPDAQVRASAEATALSIDGVNTVTNNLTIGNGNTIPDVIDGNEQLTTLYQLITEANLQDQLAGTQAFTLFAPTDEAFNALGADALAGLRADPAQLAKLLYYHLAAGLFPSSELAVGGDLASIQGENLHFENDGDVQKINFAAQFVQTDIQAENGVIHLIDQVLLPVELGGAPAAAPTPEELGAALSLDPITFDSSAATITDSGKAELDKVVTYLTENPRAVEVAGHTDTTGPEDLNQALSQERADAVRQYLIDNGIPGDSITATGYGETQPLIADDANDEEAKIKNRRIEFILN